MPFIGNDRFKIVNFFGQFFLNLKMTIMTQSKEINLLFRSTMLEHLEVERLRRK